MINTRLCSLDCLLLGCLLAVAILVGATGCNTSERPAAKPAATGKPAQQAHAQGHEHGHDHGHGDHAHPKTLEEGLAELETSVASIATALTTGAKDSADDAVHAVGHLLEDMENLVEKQNWTADVKATGRKAIAELTECFDKLDQSLHAAEGEGEAPVTVLASVTERIGKAIVSLGELIKGTNTSTDETSKEEK